MRKLWLVLILAVLTITACTPKTPVATPTALPTTAPTAISGDATTVVQDCKVASVFPEPKSPLNITVPRVSDKDWTEGPANARMVVIEYSDFQ